MKPASPSPPAVSPSPSPSSSPQPSSPSPPAPRVTLPWAQQIWDVPVTPSQRDAILSAFPPPTLDPDDRSHTAPKHVVSLAVVLDLLATRLRPLAAEPTILARAAQEAIDIGLLGGAARDAVCTRLLEHAQSTTADARATFVAAFAHAMVDVLEPVVQKASATPRAAPPSAHPTTPQSVAHAIARIAQATDLVVREAELLLAQWRARSTWQI